MDDDEAPIIYGLDYQSRCLCAQLAETEIQRFMVGTQSLKYANQIHLIEFNEDNNSISKCIYEHREGEVWHMAAAPHNKYQFLTCYNKLNSINNISMKCSIWEFPENIEMSIAADDSNSYNLKHVTELPADTSISAIWEPQSGSHVISISENCISYFDLAESSPKLISTANLEAKGQPKFTNCKWNLHHNYSQIATCNDSSIRGWDLRSMRQTYLIEGAHTQLVRDIDFNPNKQYYLVSCGDDCKTKFWDVRKPNECLKTLSEHHSHWIWSVRYNTFHDQLVLTCSSDNRVVLSSVPSLSSEPFKTSNLDADETNNKPEEQVEVAQPDRLIKIYEDHEDSIYATEWSSVDPWVFASLSYDGRLVINRVPKEEKYKILL